MSGHEDTEEFIYDEGDPSVGIFGDVWFHNQCEREDNDLDDCEEFVFAELRISETDVLVVYRLVCNSCGHEGNVRVTEFHPTDEWHAEMDRVHNEVFHDDLR